jgi:hemerythrin
MPLLIWNPRFSVGIESFDSQHKRLINLVNQLHEAMMKGKAEDALHRVLHELVEYTKTHFAAEERFMQSHGFSGYLAHKTEHDKLTKQVVDFQREFLEGKIALSISLLSFLKTWLTEHIMGTDKKYSICASPQTASR